MKKFILSQNCEIIWGIADDTVIQRVKNQIFTVGYPIYEDDIAEQCQEEEDVATVGLKKHLIELGTYDSEDRARNVMVLLVRWLRQLDGADPVFIMPEYDQNVSFDGKGTLIYHNTNLFEDLGEPDEE